MDSLEAGLLSAALRDKPSTHTHAHTPHLPLNFHPPKNDRDFEMERQRWRWSVKKGAGTVKDKCGQKSQSADGEKTGPGVNEKLLSGQWRPFRVLE